MERINTLKCPRCAKTLQSGVYHTIEIYLCSGCKGMLIKQRNLLRMLQIFSKDLMQIIDPDYPIEPLSDIGKSLFCPSCNAEMENYGYMGTDFVKIDSCRNCKVLWLDAKELGVMGLLFARTEQRRRRSQERIEQFEHDLDKTSDATILSQAAEKCLLTGFIIGSATDTFGKSISSVKRFLT
ncbi:MAG: zf-TFIIB domain-containing protein [Candidatus Omnitrophica bacterium]|nr:zf-TFIIB domain-containing protein [Candidatus Omnitrophota bacterium]